MSMWLIISYIYYAAVNMHLCFIENNLMLLARHGCVEASSQFRADALLNLLKINDSLI